ncbi:uncharacterized protein MONOS_7335 [Monocercomonoides exilis]|uniref:uncharacterized protein n=1 Tax=Monocercomonoides exilis TaxID=2049356 RepID=UPI00355A042F|nr:hypothetical protein MONOS_7335 [Monocercomonoides exilis]|eukprot:MONOS_7335.1-p1 / transcript=MONOS_7335.1 / gene=MONOS_7335 / organism=Monocercomonoides_exilis_PA203 / gene_product=unspecified product / transcript_product=unspecified product / location=Mono_scaffold00248:55667-58622(+) / protein_length=930 / sequence_SO=supercontig / SO=protein_coding / is_pseudo=false
MNEKLLVEDFHSSADYPSLSFQSSFTRVPHDDIAKTLIPTFSQNSSDLSKIQSISSLPFSVIGNSSQRQSLLRMDPNTFSNEANTMKKLRKSMYARDIEHSHETGSDFSHSNKIYPFHSLLQLCSTEVLSNDCNVGKYVHFSNEEMLKVEDNSFCENKGRVGHQNIVSELKHPFASEEHEKHKHDHQIPIQKKEKGNLIERLSTEITVSNKSSLSCSSISSEIDPPESFHVSPSTQRQTSARSPSPFSSSSLSSLSLSDEPLTTTATIPTTGSKSVMSHDAEVEVSGTMQSSIAQYGRDVLLRTWKNRETKRAERCLKMTQMMKKRREAEDKQAGSNEHGTERSSLEEREFKEWMEKEKKRRRREAKIEIKEAKEYYDMFGKWVRNELVEDEEAKALWDEAEQKIRMKEEEKEKGKSREGECVKRDMTYEEMKSRLKDADELHLSMKEKEELICRISAVEKWNAFEKGREGLSDMEKFHQAGINFLKKNYAISEQHTKQPSFAGAQHEMEEHTNSTINKETGSKMKMNEQNGKVFSDIVATDEHISSSSSAFDKFEVDGMKINSYSTSATLPTPSYSSSPDEKEDLSVSSQHSTTNHPYSINTRIQYNSVLSQTYPRSSTAFPSHSTSSGGHNYPSTFYDAESQCIDKSSSSQRKTSILSEVMIPCLLYNSDSSVFNGEAMKKLIKHNKTPKFHSFDDDSSGSSVDRTKDIQKSSQKMEPFKLRDNEDTMLCISVLKRNISFPNLIPLNCSQIIGQFVCDEQEMSCVNEMCGAVAEEEYVKWGVALSQCKNEADIEAHSDTFMYQGNSNILILDTERGGHDLNRNYWNSISAFKNLIVKDFSLVYVTSQHRNQLATSAKNKKKQNYLSERKTWKTVQLEITPFRRKALWFLDVEKTKRKKVLKKKALKREERFREKILKAQMRQSRIFS